MSPGEVPQTAAERREALKRVYAEADACQRCPELASTRKSVVFGAGNEDADLMFIGEAPGASEDEQGLPFVGQAGRLLEKLLGEIGLQRKEVFIANTLKCLRYNAEVQLGDGSWERIGRLVRRRYAGEVMAVDAAGHIVPRRVTGWHETPVGNRRVFRLTYASSNRAGAGRVGIELTGDHPVLTQRGYVPVQQLSATDEIATGQGLGDPAFDRVEIEDVTDRERADSSFFCLDVEETHNFVTAGGVVHNCRPPGNRDPLPTEIENCRDYLYSQVELIKPKVICTLGNFSTKLLRDDKTGITKLHGRPEPLTIGRRVVRLYPIFHPAAALYTPRMLQTLRDDFLRLPELLALPEPEQREWLDPSEPEGLAEAEERRRGESSAGATPSEDSAAGRTEDQLGLF